ncbi:MAG: helix-turn-helix transcriptional regulator [Alkalibacterium sp.]|uniref:Transcriptional regulator, HxlR family n=1 Tax=Alkalibacterium gilvum TaxID=1130080 RepID=A0A1H6RLW0_9LACT|nr:MULTISPECIES: helix-turn-helix domain-containing protein [Alkalibacterium]MDN6193503.1 helix-turn-helix transcriptional regulator [Alkalibacterium sp.]MDN6293481.1 helix-turn-helix transcriptional regulator [Alkalibacterium sp.]MDN6295176.1 helix-turn-helix transcriptional regulator [Alkalibacterium sp.]MDN6326581.1 helix-turn-helix transcriptional regulator [Alkalibacterium sp.]MDN6385193.1 helix-turn-helix transcriptional regulator [Alkalibacterium sp.]
MIETPSVNSDQDKVICPKFEQTFSILGKKWTGLIIDVLLDGPRRFKDISQAIKGVSDRVLVERLKELEKENIVTRELDDSCDMKSGYCLTEKGKSLKNVMIEVQLWADQWICDID